MPARRCANKKERQNDRRSDDNEVETGHEGYEDHDRNGDDEDGLAKSLQGGERKFATYQKGHHCQGGCRKKRLPVLKFLRQDIEARWAGCCAKQDH